MNDEITKELLESNPEKAEAFFRRIKRDLEIEKLIEQTERELAGMSKRERQQREREMEALWLKIERALAEEGIK